MKTRITLILSFVCLGLGLLTACQQDGKSNGNTTDADTTDADTICYSQDDGRIHCTIYAEQPEQALKQAVGEWMDEQLGGYYTGAMTDLQTMVDFYGQAWVDTLKAATTDVRAEALVAYEARIQKAYETDKIVTYTMHIYQSLGGAHPLTSDLGATFRKSDGKRLTWDIMRHDLDYYFGEIQRNMLRTYFETDNDEQLEQYLGYSIWQVPHPQTPPIFLENGIVLIYQQYEVAGYAAGMPGDTIPYDIMKPYMTEQAKLLIP